jgi:hypothetical protein
MGREGVPAGDHAPRSPWRLSDPCPPGCTCAELSHVLRRVLDAVATGEVKAVTPQERRLVRRVESALVAFEAGWSILGPDRGRETPSG